MPREHRIPSAIVIFLSIPLLFHPFTGKCQVDSTTKKMSFDFGITRDRDINLWPIFKRTASAYESDRQILFPIYQSYQNFRTGKKKSHLLPLYWKDSSIIDRNTRILSLYYPSFLHLSRDYTKNSKTFTLLEFAPRVNILEFQKSSDGLVMQNNLLFILWYKNNRLAKKSHLIVFPLYWQLSSSPRKTSTLLPLYSYGSYSNKTKHYCTITPLFWHFNAPKRSSNLLIPLWWNRSIYTSSDSIRSNLIFPIFYSHTGINTNNKVLFPIVWSISNFRYKSFTVAPLLSFGHSLNGSNQHHLMITPLFWRFTQAESKRTTLFPLVWSYQWKTRFDNFHSLVIFPLYWYKKDGDSKRTAIPPLVWNKISPEYHSFSFIPLFSTGSSPDQSVGHLAVTPLFWHFKSANSSTITVLPIWWYRKNTSEDNPRMTNIVFPLYWGWMRGTNRGNIFVPVLWRFKSLQNKSFGFIPFTFTSKATDNSKLITAITPFYWRFKTPEGKGQLLFPLWWDNVKTANGEPSSSSRVVLLYWRYKDTGRNHQGLFPMVWHFKNESQSSFTIFPLIAKGQRNNNESLHLAVSPLFWHFRNPSRSFNTLFPIWWSHSKFTSSDVKRFNLLIPVYYSQSNTDKKNRIVFPVAWSFKNPSYKSFTLVPLFAFGNTPDKSSSHLVATPLFWHFKNPAGSTSILLPILWRSNYTTGGQISEKTILFPIYWHTNDKKNRKNILFPIVWSIKSQNYKSFTLVPLFSTGRNNDNSKNHYVITPFYYNVKSPHSKSRVLFPVWWNLKKSNKNGNNSINIIYPIYWSIGNQHHNAKIVFPIIWQFQKPKSRSFTFIPFYSSGTNKNGIKHLMVTPLYWRFKGAYSDRLTFFPFFSSTNTAFDGKHWDVMLFLLRKDVKNDYTRLSIIWPIIEITHSPELKYFRFAPLIWSKKGPEFSYFTIQPFYYQGKSVNRTTNRILWELFVHRNIVGVKKSNSVLWKVASWSNYSNGDKDFRVLHLLYANSNVEGKVEKSFFPLYYYARESNGNKSFSVMFYFYNSLTRKIPNTTEYYQEERIFWLLRVRSNYRTLKERGIEIH